MRLASTLLARAARPRAPAALRQRVSAPPLRSVRAASSSSSSSSSGAPPEPPPRRNGDGEPEEEAAKFQQRAREIHPALVSVLSSGFVESRRRLRQELAEDAWRGEPVEQQQQQQQQQQGGAAGEESGGGGDPSRRLASLPHTSPPSWAARRGVARFERFVAGGGAAGGAGGAEPPEFPAGGAAAALEGAIAGMYAALLTAPLPPVARAPPGKGEDGEGQRAPVAVAPPPPPPEEATAATLRALGAACARLPTAQHRLLARAFVEESLAEALREEYARAAHESREMADLLSSAGGGSSAAGAAWGVLKRVLPLGWLGWLLPGGGGGGANGKGKGG
jgi:hypothetical protein